MATESDVVLRLPLMDKLTSGLQPLKKFEVVHLKKAFTDRAMSRGTLYSMEPGWIDEVSMTSGGRVHQVQARCFASFEKTTRRPVTVQLDGATLNSLDSFCGCVAGSSTCSHACGVLQYVAFLARSMRAVDARRQKIATTTSPRPPTSNTPRVPPFLASGLYPVRKGGALNRL